MPMYGSFDDKFNAALANKMKLQDAQGAAATTNAGANMLGAQTQAGLAPSEIEYRKSIGDATMSRAGTERGQLAAANPMGFNQNQIGSFGLRSMGFSPTATAQTYGNTMYGTDGKLGAPGQAYIDYLNKFKTDPNTPAPAGWQPGTSGWARGGVIGDVDHDTGQDTRKVMARPGEYFINPETITHGFGDGNYENGVRNLDEIVRRSTGREPGPTYPKGKAGYARSGAAGPADGMSDAAWNQFASRYPAAPANNVVTGLPRLPARQFDRALTPALATPYEDTDAAREAAVARRTAPILGGGMRDYAHHIAVPPLSNTTGGAAGAGSSPSVQYDISKGEGPPVDMTPGQWNQHVGGLRTGAGGYPMLADGGKVPNEYLPSLPSHFVPRGPTGSFAPWPSAQAQALNQAPAAPFAGHFVPRGPTAGFAPWPSAPAAKPAVPAAKPAVPAAAPAAPVAPAAPFDMSQDIGTSDRLTRIMPPSPIPTLRETDSDKFAIRDRIRGGAAAPSTTGGTPYVPQGAGGQPGEQVGINYGPGYGMGPGTSRIIATADKTGRFNSFSNLGMARGGRVMGKMKMPPPQKGLRMAKGGRVPGFINSGAFTYDLDPGVEYGPGGTPPGYSPGASFGTGQGPSWQPQELPSAARQAWARYNPNVGAAAKKVGKVIQAALPEAATVGKGLSFAGRKVLAPLAAFQDATDVYNVATDPRTSGMEKAGNVASEVGTKAGDWAGALAGAGIGGQLGLLTGPAAPIASPVLAALGGVGGYYGMDLAQGGLRKLFGGSGDSPAVLLDKQKTAEQMGPQPPQDAQAQQQPQQQLAAPTAPAAAAGPAGPDLRTMMYLRAMALGGGGPAADAEQKNLLNYMATSDNSARQYKIAAMQAERQREQENLGTITKSFYRPKLKDGKDTGELEEDPDARQRYLAESASLGHDVFHADPIDLEKHIKDWKNLEAGASGLRKAFSAGAPGRYYATQRTTPVSMEPLNFDAVMDPRSTAGLGDWVSSKWQGMRGQYGNPLATQLVRQSFIDRRTGQPTYQTAPATAGFMNPDGTQNLDALNAYAEMAKNQRR